MRFNITRLCGGKALMVAPSEEIELNLLTVPDKLGEEFTVSKSDEMMLVVKWKDMEVTIYYQGKIMFFPLTDKDKAIEYATMILKKISL